MRLADEGLRGKAVISADGQVLGEVTGVFLDTDQWRVDSLQLKLRSETADRLGTERGFFFHAASIDVPVRAVQAVGQTIVLSGTMDELRRTLAGTAKEKPGT